MADRKKTPDLLASVLNEPVLLGEDEVKAVLRLRRPKPNLKKRASPNQKKRLRPPQRLRRSGNT